MPAHFTIKYIQLILFINFYLEPFSYVHYIVHNSIRPFVTGDKVKRLFTRWAACWVILVGLVSCTSFKQIPIDRIDSYAGHKITGVEVRVTIRALILKNNDTLKFATQGGRYVVEKSFITGLTESGTPTTTKLGDIKFLTIESGNLLVVDPTSGAESNYVQRELIEPSLFQERYASQVSGEATSQLRNNLTFADRGATYNQQRNAVIGVDSDRRKIIVPAGEITAVTVENLPEGVTMKEITFRAGLDLNHSSDKDKAFQSIDPDIGNDFALGFTTHFNKRFSTQFEVAYAKSEYTYDRSYFRNNVQTDIHTDVNLAYLDATFLVKYEVADWHVGSLGFFMGPQFRYNITHDGKYDSTNYSSGFTTGLRKKGSIINVSDSDTRIVVGAEFDCSLMNHPVVADLRYSLGTKDVYTSSLGGDYLNEIWIANPDASVIPIRNSTLSFSLGYRFSL